MIKNKKIKIILSLIVLFLIISGSIFSFFYNKSKQEKSFEPKKGTIFVREIPSYYAKDAKNEESRRFYSKSIHEGHAVHVGAYRMELAIFKRNEKKAIYGIFLDNSQTRPIIPQNTKININLNGKSVPMKVFKNGLLFAIGDTPKLPQKFLISGEINKKQFSTNIEIKQFRKKPISKKQADF